MRQLISKCSHCGAPMSLSEEMSLACTNCLNYNKRNGYWPDQEPFPFKEKPAAKSSTMTLVASVCQLCGHKMDGKRGNVSGSFGKDGRACTCSCHGG